MKLWKEFSELSQKKSIPLLTPFLCVSAGICYKFLKKLQLSSIFEEDVVLSIPRQEKEKQVLIFDFDNFLVRNKFSPLRLKFIQEIRPFTGVFLFNMVHNYEIISVSDTDPKRGHNILNKIDPFGFISYRIFLNNKKLLQLKDLKRPLNLITVISTKANEFNDCFKSRTLIIPNYNEENKNLLMSVLYFFSNLDSMKIKKPETTYKFYSGSNFFETFKRRQIKLFHQRNMFLQLKFAEKFKMATNLKISEYEEVKSKFLKKENAQYTYAKNLFFELCPHFIFD